ncbi:hypothetical protein MBAV_005729 [Candidatus Magnetobacterium bavaricum]|uniref:Uncharacterized protein n=1 Tax=Candidatus Magnetobacterium bavaricum TaxID=29290 RepID=A0A0F3GJD3_9BACT|nr:hypothetical protein MBAV_005729 [Candidatus Magnetobacterium bavaricum]
MKNCLFDGKVLCFSREPGGAEILSSALNVVPSEACVILGKDYACDIYNKWGLSYITYYGNTQEALSLFLDKLHNKDFPCAVLTSATSLPKEDMTEKYLWDWAKLNNIPSIALLDQWQNYKERFSGPVHDQILKYIPDAICVMDDSAMKGMVKDGIPENHIFITGHPALANIRRKIKDVDETAIKNIRDRLGITSDKRLIVFISEPFSHSKSDKEGFTELSILREVFAYLRKRLESINGLQNDISFIVKLHPKEYIEGFKGIKDDFPDVMEIIKPLFLKYEITKEELLIVSDLVLGMSSILLMEAIVMGLPAVSLQIGAKRVDLCESVNQGLIPLITEQEGMERVLNSLLDSPDYLREYLLRIKEYSIIDDPEDQIWSVVRLMIRNNRKNNESEKIWIN